MLDQNTDRMWFVIGALVVGAGIILLANKAMPEIFVKTTESFRKLTSSANNDIRYAFGMDNIITSADLTNYWDVTIDDFDDETDTWTVTIPTQDHGWSRGLKVKESAVSIPAGKRIFVSYDLWVPEEAVGSKYVPDINNSYENTKIESTLNDNDPHEKRYYGFVIDGGPKILETGKTPTGMNLTPGEWTTVWYSYENTSPTNNGDIPLYDYSNLGATNPLNKEMQLKIRNVYGYIMEDTNEDFQ